MMSYEEGLHEHSEVQNKELYRSLRNYVVSAISLASVFGEQLPQSEQINDSLIPFIFIHEDLRALTQYRDCREQFLADDKIASHLNNLVGVSSRASKSVDLDSLMLEIPYLGIYRNRFEFNEPFFEREYRRFENAFYSDDVEYEVIAPLYGIKFEKTILLDESIEIRLLNAMDLTIPIECTVDQTSPYPPFVWAVRTRYQLKKRFGSIDRKVGQSAVKMEEEERQKANGRIDGVVTALRLLQGSSVFTPKKIHRTKSWFFDDSREYDFRVLPGSNFVLDTGEEFEKALKEVWVFLQNERVLKQTNLVVAAKRFSYAHERGDWEDQIVDLLIAAEALFLSQSGTQSELKYRLKLNAAFYVGSEASRKQIFEDMSAAYDLRSCIVHGADTRSILNKIRRREVGHFGDEYKLFEFIDRIREYIRFALIRMIRATSQSSENRTINWDDLILGIAPFQTEFSDKSRVSNNKTS